MGISMRKAHSDTYRDVVSRDERERGEMLGVRDSVNGGHTGHLQRNASSSDLILDDIYQDPKRSSIKGR